jgi:transcriptional regulator
MHPNRKFHIEDREAMAQLVRDLGFGILFASTEDGPSAVHVPILLEDGRLRFHVSKGNRIHAALAGSAEALFVATGPDAYISPEDYGLEDRVPTWNYVAVELQGPLRTLAPDELVRLVDDLSADREVRLAPKAPWTRAKMSPGRFEGLLKAITGFEMQVAQWRGTAKIDQDKPAEVRARIAEALRTRGQPEMAETMMRAAP